MADYVTLSCPSCGGKLQITNDIERFACGYCGNEHIVRRGGGIISLIPIVEGIKGIKTGVDKTAAELAYSRIKKEIENLESTYNYNKHLKLNSLLGNDGQISGFCTDFICSLYIKTERDPGSTFNNRLHTEQFLELSDDDINYALANWKEFGKSSFFISRTEIESLYRVLVDIKVLMDEKVESIQKKDTDLAKLQQTINGDDIIGINKEFENDSTDHEVIRLKNEIQDLETNYLYRKNQKLTFTDNNHTAIIGLLLEILKVSGRGKLRADEYADTLKSLSNEDINYCITHWNEFWPENQRNNPRLSGILSSVYDALVDVKNINDEKDKCIHQKEIELDYLLKVSNS